MWRRSIHSHQIYSHSVSFWWAAWVWLYLGQDNITGTAASSHRMHTSCLERSLSRHRHFEKSLRRWAGRKHTRACETSRRELAQGNLRQSGQGVSHQRDRMPAVPVTLQGARLAWQVESIWNALSVRTYSSQTFDCFNCVVSYIVASCWHAGEQVKHTSTESLLSIHLCPLPHALLLDLIQGLLLDGLCPHRWATNWTYYRPTGGETWVEESASRLHQDRSLWAANCRPKRWTQDVQLNSWWAFAVIMEWRQSGLLSVHNNLSTAAYDTRHHCPRLSVHHCPPQLLQSLWLSTCSSSLSLDYASICPSIAVSDNKAAISNHLGVIFLPGLVCMVCRNHLSLSECWL